MPVDPQAQMLLQQMAIALSGDDPRIFHHGECARPGKKAVAEAAQALKNAFGN